MKLQLKNISMQYRDKLAVDQFNYTFTEGIYGLLGANGAGKSTLIRILTGNQKSTTGEIYLDDVQIENCVEEYISKIGYVPQAQGVYPELTATQFLYYMGRLKGIPKKEIISQSEELLKSVNLYEVRDKKLGGFSGGMKQRVLIAQALLGNPRIVILDEPTAGVDPKERIRIRNIISELSFHKIVLIATHVVTDVEFISKEILIMDSGHLIRSGSPDNVVSELDGKVYEIPLSEEQYEQLKTKVQITNVIKRKQKIYARMLLPDGLPEFAQNAQKMQPDLEDLYLFLFENRE